MRPHYKANLTALKDLVKIGKIRRVFIVYGADGKSWHRAAGKYPDEGRIFNSIKDDMCKLCGDIGIFCATGLDSKLFARTDIYRDPSNYDGSCHWH